MPRLGYRMVASGQPVGGKPSQASGKEPAAAATSAASAPVSRRKAGFLAAAGVALCLVAVAGFFVRGKIGNSQSAAGVTQPQKSIAVLPFLDLTEGMKEEEFADGMTEELIDKLSKVQGFRVPSATSSFFFKGKQIPVAGIAKSLGVTYVLDGSVRKSGNSVRIAARLVRADDGYVIWSEPMTGHLPIS